MKRKKNMMAQIMAWLALFAIVIGIVGTGILVMFSSGEQSGYGEDVVQELSEEDLERIIQESQITVEGQAVDVTTEDINITSTGSAE